MHRDPTQFRNRFKMWKEGKDVYEAGLPKFYEGEDAVRVGNYNVYPSAIGASELNVTTPEVIVTGKDRRPVYQRYDAKNSIYDPNAIRAITDWAPGIGDVSQAFDAYNAFKNKDYLQGAVLAGGLVLPNTLEKSLKPFAKSFAKKMYKFALEKEIAPKQLLHDVFSDPKEVVKQKILGNYAFTNKGRQHILQKDNEKLNILASPIKENVIKDELHQRGKRVNFAESKGIQQDILKDYPDERYIQYQYSTTMDPKIKLAESTNPIEVVYYKNPRNSFFKYQWNRDDLAKTVGHEFVHRLEKDPTFSPHLMTSTPLYGETGYATPFINRKDMISVQKAYLPSSIPLTLYPEVQQLFYPTINRYNTNINRIAEANALKTNVLDLETHPWFSSPAEVIADLKGAIAAGWDENKIYKLMQDRHGYDVDAVNALRKFGYKNGKDAIRIKPSKRGTFTAAAKKHGKSVQQFASQVLANKGKYSPAMVKKANFAKNASKWNH